MNEHLNLLDAPLERPPKKASSGGSTLDYYASLFLVAAPLILLSIGLVPALQSTWFFAAIAMLVLGIYQLISAIVGGARGNAAKGKYAIVAVAYIAFLFVFLEPMIKAIFPGGDIRWLANVIFIFVIPGLGAVYYTLLCRQAMLNDN